MFEIDRKWTCAAFSKFYGKIWVGFWGFILKWTETVSGSSKKQ